MGLDPVSILLDLGGKVFDRLFPDPAQAAQAKLEMFKLQQSGELAQITGQMDINKTEAASASVFVAGARPSVIWVCSIALAFQLVLAPLLTWIAALFGSHIMFPTLDTGTLTSLLMALLGLGGMRTVEKLNGVARDSL